MVPIGLQIIYCFYISLASSFVIYADHRGRAVKYDGRIGMMKTTIRVGETEISRIGYGTLYLPVERGFGPARPNAVDLLKEARNLGIQFFDTADSYGNGSAEEAIREALHPYDNIVIASKGGFRHERLGSWVSDARPERLRSCLEGSLRRLGLEYIDLYQLHCPDNRVPYADAVGALAEMQQEGKILHIGISNVNLEQIRIATREVDIVSIQNAYNILHQGHSDILEYCESKNIVFIPWMPLGDGSISWDRPMLKQIAQKHGSSPAQIALVALLHHSPAILPIPGTSSLDHLRENIKAGNINLDAEDLVQLMAR
jgi:aryl-alcohol dehydrogenase-like predicted oxidoreductase